MFDTMPFSIVLSFRRFAADQLKHEYGVELVNVFDTMLADVVFCSWSSQPPVLQKRARGYQAGVLDTKRIIADPDPMQIRTIFSKFTKKIFCSKSYVLHFSSP